VIHPSIVGTAVSLGEGIKRRFSGRFVASGLRMTKVVFKWWLLSNPNVTDRQPVSVTVAGNAIPLQGHCPQIGSTRLNLDDNRQQNGIAGSPNLLRKPLATSGTTRVHSAQDGGVPAPSGRLIPVNL